jgi:hypothetical protein
MVFPGRVFWALVCSGASSPLLRLVDNDWTLPRYCSGPRFVVILDVHVAPPRVQWWWLHALWVLNSRRQ